MALIKDQAQGEEDEEPPNVLIDSSFSMERTVDGWRDLLLGSGMLSDVIRPCVPSILSAEIAVHTEVLMQLATAGTRPQPQPQPTIH